MSFERLVRFEDTEGKIYYGEAPETSSGTTLVGSDVDVIENPFAEASSLSTNAKSRKKIVRLLSPIPQAAHIYGVGLNYRGHAAEANLPTPGYPMIFSKPNDALAGPYDDIPVHKDCKLMDYEGELCVIIGKDCKNISESDDPLDYVLGYCASNDVSSRDWQMPERAGQAGYAKGFDKFAPIGPLLASPKLIPDIGALSMVTTVNGEQGSQRRSMT